MKGLIKERRSRNMYVSGILMSSSKSGIIVEENLG